MQQAKYHVSQLLVLPASYVVAKLNRSKRTNTGAATSVTCYRFTKLLYM